MKKKALSLLLTLAMLCSLAVTANAADTTGDLAGSTVILHTNDVHGAIDGYAKVAALKADYEARGAYVLLLDAGDFSQGDVTVSTTEGATAVELMNLAGYDAAATGNHEFDYGYANLQDLASDADFPFLAANVLYNGKLAFTDNVTFTAPGGMKIGVFGLDTPETATKAHPAKIQGVTFLAGQDMFDCAQAQVDALKADGCDVVVCLGHLGIDAESAGNCSIDLLEQVDGIDVFIDGHSHSTMDEIFEATGTVVTLNGAKIVMDGGMVNGTILVSTGTKLANVGVITINAKGNIRDTSVSTDSLTDSVKAVADRAAAIQADIDKEYGAVFAKTEVDLNGDRDPGNRTEETNLGDLITDALVWGAKQAGTEVDAALTNGGGIRAPIAKGDITKKDINTVLPFGNTLSIVKVTGAELLEALEASTYCTPTAIGGFPQVSGIQFTVDTTKTFDQGAQYPGSTYYAPKTINRVTIQSVGGKAFDAKAVYTIATNDFLAAGGDTYYAFKTATVNYDLGTAMDEVVMNYVKAALNGTVTAAAYGAPAGRITVVKGLPFTDVPATAWYYDGVAYAYENGIFSGKSATTFAPSDTMTRGQMVTVLWRLAGSPAAQAPAPFTDVAADSAFATAIAWAYNNQIVSGYTATTFNPGRAVSRQQFATILYNYAKFMGYDVTAGGMAIREFADYDQIAAYALQGLSWANAAGLVNGNTATTINPQGTAPRYQVAVILMRFCENIAK